MDKPKPIPLPPLKPEQLPLLKGEMVQLRIYYGDSYPGTKYQVKGFFESAGRWYVKVYYGANMSGQRSRRTVPLDVLCLLEEETI